MFLRYLVSNYYRKKYLKRLEKTSTIGSYLSSPLISGNRLIKDLEFLVLDFETTGLNATHDKIISLGYTVIKGLHLLPKTSTHILINPKQRLAEDNVGIHQLTDEELLKGVSLHYAIEKLLPEMANRIVIAHFDTIERSFMNQACFSLYQMKYFPMVMLDTLKIEQKKMRHAGVFTQQESVRLFALREKYNLPRYKAHNAMQDAIATAELFLAQVDHMGKKDSIRLRDLI